MRQKPLTQFDIRPSIGALPVTFGMHRDEVHELLGPPDTSGRVSDGSGFIESFTNCVYRVGYDSDWKVNHLGFGPGRVALSLEGKQVWSANAHPDPNPSFLALDSAPVRRGDLLVFVRLGVQTSGYRYGDKGNGIINVYPLNQMDRVTRGRRVPVNMSRYYRVARLPHNPPMHRTGPAV